MQRRQPVQPMIEEAGAVVRAARRNVGCSQRELSRRSGVSQSEICRIEVGSARDVRVSVLDRLFVALGVRYRLGTEMPRSFRPQVDLVHARCTAYVTRRLIAMGWLVEREVEIGGDRARGWIDLLAFHPDLGIVLVLEVKTELHDVGGIERTMNWYQREAPRAAWRFGWRPTAIGSALLVLHSREVDDRIVTSSAVFATAFPGRTRQLRAMLGGAAERTDMRYLALIDPRSRRANWLRATRSEGRRSDAPYVDYIDAARQLSARSPTVAPRHDDRER